MQRNGTAHDVAAAAIFFATAPHFITGQLLAVDGGLAVVAFKEANATGRYDKVIENATKYAPQGSANCC